MELLIVRSMHLHGCCVLYTCALIYLRSCVGACSLSMSCYSVYVLCVVVCGWEREMRERAIITPHACARGKAISLYVCCHHCRHKNHQFGQSRYLSDLQSKQICRNQWKTGLSMLRIVLHQPPASQIEHFCPYLSTTPTYWAMCSLHMRIIGLVW